MVDIYNYSLAHNIFLLTEWYIQQSGLLLPPKQEHIYALTLKKLKQV